MRMRKRSRTNAANESKQEEDVHEEQDGEDYEVERICARKVVRRQRLYLVKWVGYVNKTWESAEHLTSCPD